MNRSRWGEIGKLAVFVPVAVALWLFAGRFASPVAYAEDREANAADLDRYASLLNGHAVSEQREYTEPDRPTVYLTFDDGPSRLTPKVLDILREEGVPATFFVLGEQVERYPEIVRRIKQEGHALGNHTYNHVYAELYSDFDKFWAQIRRTEDILEQTAGVRPAIVRAPGGTYTNFDIFYFYYLDQAGYTVFDWNVDSGDARRPGVPAREIVANATKVTQQNRIVVLMHDGPGHDETVKALPDVIAYYKRKGYAFAAITQDVRPVTFPLGPVKWARKTPTPEQYAKRLAQIRAEIKEVKITQRNGEDGGRDAELRQTNQGQAERTGSDGRLGEKDVSPLTLLMDDRIVRLESGTYQFRDERFYVPLRLLVESMGGRVEWDGDSRRATVHYGMYTAVYDLKRKTIGLKSPSGDRTIHLASMELRDGSIIVPLRHTVELLGDEIVSYSLDPRSREVRIDLRYGYRPAVARPVAPDDGKTTGWAATVPLYGGTTGIVAELAHARDSNRVAYRSVSLVYFFQTSVR